MLKLIVEIFKEEITIKFDQEEYLEVIKWTQDEWEEDPENVMPAIANAIKLAYTDPFELIRINQKHINSQLEIMGKDFENMFAQEFPKPVFKKEN